jgi:exopolyphosphatase/guanosine-5'-triphosphate,3'-diphosphate pyrophosphatase
VGTNSVKLLVADVQNATAVPVAEASHQTRLGEGLFRLHLLQPQAIARTVDAVVDFVEQARTLGAEAVRLYATSAAREAANRNELADALKAATGLALEIIPAETEAEWAFLGVLSHPGFAGQDFLLLDLGGGSAQFIVGAAGHARFQASYPLGCVRWLEKTHLSDPPTPQEKEDCGHRLRAFMTAAVQPAIQPHLPPACHWVGIGGTATILGRMELGMTGFEREKLENLRLPAETLRQWRDRLWAMPLARRRQVPGLPANRADVILMGTAIFAEVMELFHFKELRLSTRGPRFGALLTM